MLTLLKDGGPFPQHLISGNEIISMGLRTIQCTPPHALTARCVLILAIYNKHSFAESCFGEKNPTSPLSEFNQIAASAGRKQ